MDPVASARRRRVADCEVFAVNKPENDPYVRKVLEALEIEQRGSANETADCYSTVEELCETCGQLPGAEEALYADLAKQHQITKEMARKLTAMAIRNDLICDEYKARIETLTQQREEWRTNFYCLLPATVGLLAAVLFILATGLRALR